MCELKDLKIRPISNGFIITNLAGKEFFAKDLEDGLYTLSIFLVDQHALISSETGNKPKMEENDFSNDCQSLSNAGFLPAKTLNVKEINIKDEYEKPDLSKILSHNLDNTVCAICESKLMKGSSIIAFQDKNYHVHRTCKNKLYSKIYHPKCFICHRHTRSDGIRYVKGYGPAHSKCLKNIIHQANTNLEKFKHLDEIEVNIKLIEDGEIKIP